MNTFNRQKTALILVLIVVGVFVLICSLNFNTDSNSINNISHDIVREIVQSAEPGKTNIKIQPVRNRVTISRRIESRVLNQEIQSYPETSNVIQNLKLSNINTQLTTDHIVEIPPVNTIGANVITFIDLDDFYHQEISNIQKPEYNTQSKPKTIFVKNKLTGIHALHSFSLADYDYSHLLNQKP